jgi:hypothetical protein
VTAFVWAVVIVVFVLRAIGAFVLPLTGDEGYYWEWSRRLAFGYVDHPPAVAWTIASFGQFGNNPGFVRLGFVICGAIATYALARCATLIADDRRAGAAAALAFSVTPLASIAFGSAQPDGPYLMFWCVALWFSVRAFRFGLRRDYVILGIALGGVLLSRMFGFALVAGIVAYALAPGRRHFWKQGLALSLGVCALVYSPFLIWNATHDWVTFAFALVHRHEGQRLAQSALRHVLSLYAAQAAAYSPGIWLGVLILAVRPRNALLAWTSLPLLVGLTLLALVRDVEIHWVFGAFASLCAMMGVAYVQLAARPRIVWTTIALVPAAVLLPAIFAMTFAPGASYRVIQRETGVQLRNTGPFEIFAYRPLALDVARIARERDAIVMTDGYGLSSVIDFNANVPPVVIGYDWQGRESHAWYPSTMHPRRALFVDRDPLSTRPDFQQRLAQACGRVLDGGVHSYRYGDAPPRLYYFTWCESLVPDALAILRWETPGIALSMRRPGAYER